MKASTIASSVAGFVLFAGLSQAASVVLYNQNFENPAAYHNDGADVNIYRTVNDNYANQPDGFQFQQQYTVETLNVSGSDRGTGSAAWGTGWSDPSGKGGNFAIGMLGKLNADLLGLSFDVGDYDFFNVSVDVSSIDLSSWGGPFVNPGDVPVFRFSLFDNPGGGLGVGSGIALSSFDLTGTASDRDVFDWTTGIFGLSTEGNTDGNVILQIDLLQGGYAALDNLKLEASDTLPPETPAVPLPAGLPLLAGGLVMLGLVRRRRN